MNITYIVVDDGATYNVRELDYSSGNCCCCNQETTITVPPIVNPTPVLTVTPTTRSIQSGAFASFTATADIANSTFNWYTDGSTSTILFTGSVFQTPTLTASHTYYVEAVSPDGVKSARSTATVTVASVSNPTYTAPQLNISVTPNIGQLEIGTPINVSIASPFTQNDAGALLTRVVKLNGTSIGTANPQAYTGAITASLQTFTATVTYGEGAIKNDSAGNPYPTGHILAGTLNQTYVASAGLYQVFYGSTDTVITTTNARSLLGNSTWAVTAVAAAANWSTGTIAKTFQVVVPPGFLLDSVIYTFSGIDVHMEDQFVATSIQVPDAGGNNVAYTKYVMTNGVPYSTSQDWKLKLKTA